MLFSAPGVDSQIHIKCCKRFSRPEIHRIEKCFKQTPRRDCRNKAYKVEDENGRMYCVTPKWLQKRLNPTLSCSPDITPNWRKKDLKARMRMRMNWKSKRDAAWQLLGK
ncbi:hypothetical protein NQZ68_020124 [Dissostichus eleginoides]|nr:hypothetical protein NQZ68_020124 [Dissostichus eleginoides]